MARTEMGAEGALSVDPRTWKKALLPVADPREAGNKSPMSAEYSRVSRNSDFPSLPEEARPRDSPQRKGVRPRANAFEIARRLFTLIFNASVIAYDRCPFILN
jgi:hypothetical protein